MFLPQCEHRRSSSVYSLGRFRDGRKARKVKVAEPGPSSAHSCRGRRAVRPRRLSAHHRRRWSAHELCVGRSQGQRHCVRCWEVCREEHCQQAQRVAILAAKGAGRLCSRRQWYSHRTARAERRDQGGNHADQVSSSSAWAEASRQRRAVLVGLSAHREAGITTRLDRPVDGRCRRACQHLNPWSG